MKAPAIVELKVEEQPAHQKRVPCMPVDALVLLPENEVAPAVCSCPSAKSGKSLVSSST
jgi:hypothetical protein